MFTKSWFISLVTIVCFLFTSPAKAQYGCSGGTVTQSQQTIGYIPIHQIATTSYQTVQGAPVMTGGCNGGNAMMGYGCNGGAPTMGYRTYQYAAPSYGCNGGTTGGYGRSVQQSNYYYQRTGLFGRTRVVIRQY